MREFLRSLPGLLAVLVLTVAAGCGSFRDVSIFTTEQEIEIGQKVSADIESQMKMLDNREVVTYVRRVGSRVASKADRQDITYTFNVIDDSKTVNAFAVPGGNIYVYTGLLTRLHSEAELAAVLGHETAHIAQRHSMKALTRQVGFGIMLRAVLGQEPAAWQEIIANVAGNLAFLSFSRTDEKEADALGLEYMHKAGYDPEGMVNLLTVFLDLAQREPTAMEIWLSTHPPSSERIELVKQQISRLGTTGGKVGTDEYARMLRELR